MDPTWAHGGDATGAGLIIDGRVISYGELAEAVDRCATRLAASGVANGRVAVVDVGSLLSIATMFGAARVGAAAALMNPALTPPEVQRLVENAGWAAVGGAGGAYVHRLPEAGLSQVFTAADLSDDRGTAQPPPAQDSDRHDWRSP